MSFLDKITSGDIGSFSFLPNIKSGVVYFFQTILYGGIIFALAFVIYKMFFEYKISVTVLKKIGTGALGWSQDRAKIVVNRSDSSRYLKLQKTKQGRNRLTTQIPISEFKGKAGKRDHYTFLLDDNFQLQPVKMNLNFKDPALNLFAEDKRWWARKEDKRRLEKFVTTSKIEKYLPSLIVLGAFIVTFFIAYFGFTHIGAAMGSLASQVGQVATTCTTVIGG